MRNIRYFTLAYFLHAPAVLSLSLLLTLQSCGWPPDRSGSNLVCWGVSPFPCPSGQAPMPRAGPLPLPLLLGHSPPLTQALNPMLGCPHFSPAWWDSLCQATLLHASTCRAGPLLLPPLCIDTSHLTWILELPTLTFWRCLPCSAAANGFYTELIKDRGKRERNQWPFLMAVKHTVCGCDLVCLTTSL